MLLIIDGYNLLSLIYKKSFVSEKQREKFILELAEYARKKNHEIILVFDGNTVFSSYNYNKYLKVIYTGARTADEYIKEYIEYYKPNNTAVISSDLDIYNFVSAFDVPTVDSSVFYEQFKTSKSKNKLKILRSHEQIYKLNNNNNDPELDALMQESTEFLMYKDENLEKVTKTKGKEKKLSKHERLLLNIIKKL